MPGGCSGGGGGGRGCGNHGCNARITDIGQPHRNPPDHPNRVDDISVSGGEHVDSTSDGVAGAYLATLPPQPVPAHPTHPPLVPPNPQPTQLVSPFQADTGMGALMT